MQSILVEFFGQFDPETHGIVCPGALCVCLDQHIERFKRLLLQFELQLEAFQVCAVFVHAVT